MVAASSLLREQGQYWMSPHPSIEGRGSWPGGEVRLWVNGGGKGDGGGRGRKENEPTSTMT